MIGVDLLRCCLPARPDPALAAAARRPFLARAAEEALAVARARPDHATPVLARWFRSARRLGSHDRPVVAEAVWGVIRHQGLLDRAGARDDAERLTLWTRLVEGERFEALTEDDPVDAYAAALSVPAAVAGGWLAVLGPAEAGALGAALAGPAPTFLRANRARCTAEALVARLAAEGVESERVEGLPDAVLLRGRRPVQGLQSWREGWFEIQDLSSQRLVEALLAHAPEGPVLDLCAGAGGKALALAAAGREVHVEDVRTHALAELRRRAARAGAPIRFGATRAPVVLVDAPCSGSGRLRRDPALRWGLDPGRHLAAQRALLAAGAARVTPGGLLAYATCSMIDAENAHDPPGAWERVEEVRLWPHREAGDGFAWRMWRKR